MNTVRRLTVATALAPLTIVVPAPAGATPAYGMDVDTLSQSTNNGNDYIVRQITINPGGSTGWHYHTGETFGIVRAGTLTHYAADCTVDGVYQQGGAVNEPPGEEHVHLGRNLGPAPLVLLVVFVPPAGAKPTVDVPDPGCGFG